MIRPGRQRRGAPERGQFIAVSRRGGFLVGLLSRQRPSQAALYKPALARNRTLAQRSCSTAGVSSWQQQRPASQRRPSGSSHSAILPLAASRPGSVGAWRLYRHGRTPTVSRLRPAQCAASASGDIADRGQAPEPLGFLGQMVDRVAQRRARPARPARPAPSPGSAPRPAHSPAPRSARSPQSPPPAAARLHHRPAPPLPSGPGLTTQRRYQRPPHPPPPAGCLAVARETEKCCLPGHLPRGSGSCYPPQSLITIALREKRPPRQPLTAPCPASWRYRTRMSNGCTTVCAGPESCCVRRHMHMPRSALTCDD